MFKAIRDWSKYSFNSPTAEGIKEIIRWTIFFVISWGVTETLNQLVLVPERLTVEVWVFTYVIPLRMALQVGLTMLGRFADKWLFERSKDNLKYKMEQPKGILPL